MAMRSLISNIATSFTHALAKKSGYSKSKRNLPPKTTTAGPHSQPQPCPQPQPSPHPQLQLCAEPQPQTQPQLQSQPQAQDNMVGDFALLRVVGKGSFAKVILVRKKGSGQLYAMKVLSKPKVIKRRQVAHTKAERRILEKVGHSDHHPYITQLHCAFQSTSKLYLVMEYCSGGELFTHLQNKRQFCEAWARIYAAELVLALHHLHQHGIIYQR